MADRVVELQPGAGRARWPSKSPDEILDYGLDWTRRLCTAAELARLKAGEAVVPADTVAESTFTLPPGLIADRASNSATVAGAWLSGGVDGMSYSVVNRIKTKAGRVMEQAVKLRVRAK
ncbi:MULTISPECIES: hypothetical protein [unclassified Bradyrhizobium]|uniref:phage fiber-tail adaptor protein n=1 Tax=unclassified Bradyrhizobium TaxID=2631580 RepID=UPI001BA78CF4|nr:MULTISPECIES: hypothetical protein [unclassified Bradyrhizobium]WLA52370.1 hypothetical protein QIH80_21120 [Bradyrhizobium elkanii]MBR1206965.1 hypothetical protein [Bradyrhizobium sp. AUGA SZCCT0124]MBR1313504.1 hypothetical protein [Bradyrhizobium sp. AUGA SZCCT0051]MBR1343399.1 hypothetical protein [Bradyrhizobium sp. AUGA SZCCT0105]MBR1357181.1 hypothetical protein [Bradyrhizobium sp. AUGA SZCCT0045]